MIRAALYALCFHILKPKQRLRKWILCPGFCSPGQAQEQVAVVLLVIPQLCVLMIDMVTMTMVLVTCAGWSPLFSRVP